MRVPWIARRSNQSILKDFSTEYSLEELILKLKLQSEGFGHLIWRTDSLVNKWCWEKLKAGEGDNRGWDGWMASLTQCTWVWASSRSWWWTGKPGRVHSMRSQRVGHDWATDLNYILYWGFPGDVRSKEPVCQCRRHKRHGFDPCVRKIPWRRVRNPLLYPCLENLMDRGAWWTTVHKVAKSQTQLKWLNMHAHIFYQLFHEALNDTTSQHYFSFCHTGTFFFFFSIESKHCIRKNMIIEVKMICIPVQHY